jgi:hypothetical protein
MRRHEERLRDSPPWSPAREAAPAPVAQTAASAVLALQRQAGNRATVALLARQPKTAHSEHFVIGQDVSLPFAKRAQQLAAKGLGAAQLRELHDLAHQSDQSVDDSERLFVTALLEPGNRERLAAVKLKAGERVSLTLALDQATKANLRKVADINRPEIDPAIAAALDEASDARADRDRERADKATKRAETTASQQILKLAGSANKKRASEIVAYAEKHQVPLTEVVAAMINAASDSTSGDLVCAGIAYAVAAAAAHQGAGHLRSGAVKVDERPIPGGASGLYNPVADATGGKGDTLFLPPTLSITNLNDRSTVIHELQHALQDARAPAGPAKLADRGEAEIEAYTTEGEYTLRQLAALPAGAERKEAAQQIAQHWGLARVAGMILASQADKSGAMAAIIKEVNALAPANDRVEAKALDTVLTAPASELRKLIKAGQKASSITFNRLSGESRISSVLPRKRIQSELIDVVTFTVGVELIPELAQKAWDRTRGGALDDAGLAELRAIALAKGETIDDNERMFIAGLLDPANAAKLHRLYPRGFAEDGLAVEFESRTITVANRNRVKDFGRNARPAGSPISEEQEKRERGTDAGIDREMHLMAGPLNLTVTQSLALADEAKISHLTVYYAMLNAASDSTPADRALSAAAYVVARREGFGEAADLLAGRIKVDAVPSTYFPNDWEAMYSPGGATTKGDTLYLPMLLDPSTLKGQGTIVHELRHAADDKASARDTKYVKAGSELAAYRREARFYLEQLAKRTGEARSTEIHMLGERLSEHLAWCLILESNARPELEEAYAFNDIVRQLNAVSTPITNAQLERGLDHSTVEENENAAIRAINKIYHFHRGQTGSRGGLRGESELDE